MKSFAIPFSAAFLFLPALSLAASVKLMSAKRYPSTRRPASEVTAAETAPKPPVEANPGGLYSVEQFVTAERQAYEKSSARIILSRSEKEADLQNVIAKVQDPWAVSNVSTGTRTPDFGKPDVYENKTILQYTRKEGYSFSAYAGVADAANRDADPTRSWQTYGASVGYEFLKTNRSFQESIKLTELAGKIAKLNAEIGYLGQVSSVNDAALSLFTQHCRLRDTQRLESLMVQTMKIAEAQLASRSIDIQDYLRMNDLYLSFQRSIQSAQSNIADSENGFAAYSEENFDIARALPSKQLDCDKILQDSAALVAPAREDVNELIHLHPSMVSLSVRREEGKKNLDVYDISRLPSLQASLGADRYNPGMGQDAYTNSYISLTFSYSFSGDSYKYNKIEYVKKVGDVDYLEKQTAAQLRGQITQLYDSMANEANLASIAKKSLENSARNLQVTRTRQDIGAINAEAAYSAYSSYSASIQAMRDLWLGYKVSQFRLAEIKNSIERTRRVK